MSRAEGLGLALAVALLGVALVWHAPRPVPHRGRCPRGLVSRWFYERPMVLGDEHGWGRDCMFAVGRGNLTATVEP